MGLIQDAIELAQAGYSSTSTVLDFLKPLGSERNYLVWSEILTGTGAVAGILWEQDEKLVDSFDRFRLQLVQDLAKDIGFEGNGPEETEDRIQLRVKILQAAAAAKDPKSVSLLSFVCLVDHFTSR